MPNELVVTVRRTLCEFVRCTAANRNGWPFGVKTRPDIVSGLDVILTKPLIKLADNEFPNESVKPIATGCPPKVIG